MSKMQNKILIAAFIALVLVSYLMREKTLPAEEPKKTVAADTLIPAGYVLVPLQISNIEAVAGLIDQFGVIDLYGGKSEDTAVQIASRVKVLRAPLNPQQYAVLVTESLSREIMKYKGPFWAVVQNRSARAAEHVASVSSVRAVPVEIEYYKGDHK